MLSAVVVSSACHRALAATGRVAVRVAPASQGLLHSSARVARVAALKGECATLQAHPESNGSGSLHLSVPSFQEAIFRLQEFWSKQGCIICLPHNTEVGAGTMNPATFLRVLGPEPWAACYAEPSIRPDDSRYGDNPNRVQRHTQFQVILKPDPGRPQELYLESLAALGIDAAAHDVRFVEDNWESPALGAWGLGWEVWLDGMEVTQFTYFQQAGSQALPVPAVEITYGLERILMALQGVRHVRDIRYGAAVTYGELFMQNEYEMSVFNLDAADTGVLREHFALYEQEAVRMLDARLPIPAYDHVLKLSHAFNVLDARGAVGFTERQDIFARLRGLAKRVSALFLQRREELGFPLGTVLRAPDLPAPPEAGPLEAPADFVLEVGTEELPPADASAALAQLNARLPGLLAGAGLVYTRVSVHSTPRRLVVRVAGLAPVQEVTEEVRRGPPRSRAYGGDGAATKALLGFCKSNGVEPEAVYLQADRKGTEYCYVKVQAGGAASGRILADCLPQLLGSLSFGRSMRWRPHSEVSFSRPIRWLLALHGTEVVPVRFGELVAHRSTWLTRNNATPCRTVASAAEYLAALESDNIQLDEGARRRSIWEGVQQAAQDAVAEVPPEYEKDLLEEVAGLVEAPTVVSGTFDEEFLRLPAPVLVTAMRKHQRYFPLVTPGSAELINGFITVANGAVDTAAVRAGNEAVLRARLEDAAFFYEQDLKRRLEDHLPALEGTVFHRQLGSMLDKARRCAALAPMLAARLGYPDAAAAATEAARLCKADLATAIVTEMTSLAGVMGRHYAEREGMPEEVSMAIYESVLPRSAHDALPTTPAGIVVACADRLDSLVGLVAVGALPSGSADPFGMRRTVYGLLQTLIHHSIRVSLPALIEDCACAHAVEIGATAKAALLEFVSKRLEQLLLDEGVPAEAVRAVLAESGDDPTLAVVSARELADELGAGEASNLPAVLQALSRPTRLLQGKDLDVSPTVDISLFDCQEEVILWDAYRSALGALRPGMGCRAWVNAVQPLVAPLDTFFERVFVMAEDTSVRRNRLAIMRELAYLSRGVLDLGELPGF